MSRIAVAVVATFLAGCAGTLPDAPAPLDPDFIEAAVARGDGIDPSGHSGEFAMRAPFSIPNDGADLPVVLYAGISPEDETRLSIQSLVDLRVVQAKLPALLSGIVAESCKHQFALDFRAADVQDEDLRAWGTVDARFFRCRGKEDDPGARGSQYLSAQIDAYAVATVEIVNQCAVVKLRDVRLDPRGFLGGVASLLGLTGIARSVIMNKGTEFLEENPICPELPSELASLVPRYDAAGPFEVGEGGLGSQLSGSVDVSAATLINLLAVLKKSEVLEERQ